MGSQADEDEQEAIFLREGECWIPSELAQGPWDPQHMHGGPICGALARAIEDCEVPAPMRVVRLSVEMTRAVPLAPFVVRAEVTRAGRRVQQIDARIEAGGETLARARALRLRVTEADPDVALPLPGPAPSRSAGIASAAGNPPRGMAFFPGFIRAVDFVHARAPEPGVSGLSWSRLRVPLVAGEETTPFARLATLSDFASGTGNALDFRRYTSINPDLSLHLVRLPRGEWIGLEAWSHLEADGIGQSHAALFDEEGVVARALVSLLVERRPGPG